MGQIREEQIRLLQSPQIAGKVECAQNSASMQGSNAWRRIAALGPLAVHEAMMIRCCLRIKSANLKA